MDATDPVAAHGTLSALKRGTKIEAGSLSVMRDGPAQGCLDLFFAPIRMFAAYADDLSSRIERRNARARAARRSSDI
jgi:hypothetical protein